tara:strand:+ start:232 stop:345 length:114 start_codon:yes stop_codon:yes gene_type:complete
MLVEFEADLKKYKKQGTEVSYTLKNIRNLKSMQGFYN